MPRHHQPVTPFDRVEWLRLPLTPHPNCAAVLDPFELLTPPVVTAIMAAATRPHSTLLIPSDELAAQILHRPPVLTWAERVSLVQPLPIASLIEVESAAHLHQVLHQLSPAVLYSSIQLPYRHIPIRRSHLTIGELARRLEAANARP